MKDCIDTFFSLPDTAITSIKFIVASEVDYNRLQPILQDATRPMRIQRVRSDMVWDLLSSYQLSTAKWIINPMIQSLLCVWNEELCNEITLIDQDLAKVAKAKVAKGPSKVAKGGASKGGAAKGGSAKGGAAKGKAAPSKEAKGPSKVVNGRVKSTVALDRVLSDCADFLRNFKTYIDSVCVRDAAQTHTKAVMLDRLNWMVEQYGD